MRILFIDVTTPRPYSPRVLEREALGGTEATVIRIAEALAAQDNEVTVAQHCAEYIDIYGAKYGPLSLCDTIKTPDAVIVLRDAGPLPYFKGLFPDAKLYLWTHDVCTPSFLTYIPVLEETKPIILTVSDWHKTQTIEMLKCGLDLAKTGVIVKRIYNPIDDSLRPDNTPVDPNKLYFPCSPHKGLEDTIALFEKVRDQLPNFKLYYSNPGYMQDAVHDSEYIINLGKLPHSEVMHHMRSSFAVFTANRVFPETFGIVYAEANAVGRPCLAHNFGALRELLIFGAQFVNTADFQEVVKRLKIWQKYPPIIEMPGMFRTSEVVKEWTTMLNSPRGY